MTLTHFSFTSSSVTQEVKKHPIVFLMAGKVIFPTFPFSIHLQERHGRKKKNLRVNFRLQSVSNILLAIFTCSHNFPSVLSFIPLYFGVRKIVSECTNNSSVTFSTPRGGFFTRFISMYVILKAMM